MARPSPCLAGDLGQRGQAGDVGAAFAELGIDRGQHVALVERVENFDRAHDFEIGHAAALDRRERRRPAQAEIGQAEPRARDLAVIGGGVLRRHVVIGLGLRVLAHGLGGAALPIAAARQRVRIGGAFADMREMGGGGRRVVQEAQRDPAGGEIAGRRGSCRAAAARRRARRDRRSADRRRRAACAPGCAAPATIDRDRPARSDPAAR